MWRKIAGDVLDRYIIVADILIVLTFSAFVAAGADQLLSSLLDGMITKVTGGAGETKKAGARPAPLPPPEPAFAPVDGKAILSRNFFDSETGPLDGSRAKAEAEAEAAAPEDPNALPPRCTVQFTLVGLFAGDDEQWSFATIQNGPKAEIAGVGDVVQSYRVKGITWKYLFLTPASGGGGSCYMDIWNEKIDLSGALVAQGPAPASAPPPYYPPGTTQPPEQVPEQLDAAGFQNMLQKSISDVSPTEKNVDKSLISYLKDNKDILKQAGGKAMPNIENDEIKGVKVFGIRKTSLWGRLGVQNGDVIGSINGMPFPTDPGAAQEMLHKLQGSDHLTIGVTRRGQPVSLEINVK